MPANQSKIRKDGQDDRLMLPEGLCSNSHIIGKGAKFNPWDLVVQHTGKEVGGYYEREGKRGQGLTGVAMVECMKNMNDGKRNAEPYKIRKYEAMERRGKGFRKIKQDNGARLPMEADGQARVSNRRTLRSMERFYFYCYNNY